MKLPFATACNSDAGAWTITTSAPPSSPVAIALPVPWQIVSIFTLFSSSNLLLSTSSIPVSQVEVVVDRRNSCGDDCTVSVTGDASGPLLMQPANATENKNNISTTSRFVLFIFGFILHTSRYMFTQT